MHLGNALAKPDLGQPYLRSLHHVPRTWLGQTILEPADVGFIGYAIAITETSSAQAAPLIAMALPVLSAMAAMLP